MKKVLIILCFILSACCSSGKYNALLDSRIGMNEEDLIAQIGNPTSVDDTDGQRVLEYVYSDTYCPKCDCGTDWCKTHYIIKDGKVDRWSYKGNHCCIE